MTAPIPLELRSAPGIAEPSKHGIAMKRTSVRMKRTPARLPWWRCWRDRPIPKICTTVAAGAANAARDASTSYLRRSEGQEVSQSLIGPSVAPWPVAEIFRTAKQKVAVSNNVGSEVERQFD
jgi:hypothetical protein